jgi:formate hydrogenlyase subunit 3/multisubunit Na+/H+ antiporter MnhD subunit
MPIPTAPTLLLAVGGVLLILSRYVRAARWFETVWMASVIGTMWLLATSSSAGLTVWAADPLGVAGQSLALVVGTLFGIGSFGIRSSDDRPAERFGFLSFQMAGVMLVAVANDAITLALSVEVVQFASLALRKLDGQERHGEQRRLSLNQPVVSRGDTSLWTLALASICLWLGIALLSNMTASTHYDEIRLVLTDAYHPGPNRTAIGAGSKLGLLGIGLMVAGL